MPSLNKEIILIASMHMWSSCCFHYCPFFRKGWGPWGV